MKMGFRTPSPKRSFSARTTGKINRTIKKATNPLYGKKGMGYINNPKKAIYNNIYNKTTTGVNQLFSGSSSVSRKNFDAQTAITRIKQLNETADIINKTTNVSTFFSRFEFALQICDELVNYEYTGVMKTITPTQQKRELLEQIPSTINSLIVRSYDKAYTNAQSLKTEKGRRNRMIHFFDILIEELNQYGAQYITEINISKIHELLAGLNIENEVTVNLTPIKIILPTSTTQSIVAPQNTYHSPIHKDEKKICPNCKGIFINHNVCPNCGCYLIDESQESYEYAENYTSNKSGCLTAFIALICAIPFPIAGSFFLNIGRHGISILTFTIYFLIIYIFYQIGKNN